MESEWFRWVIGIIVTLQTGVIGSIAALCWGQQRQMGVLDKRIALLEGRDHIDPISYTKVMTEFSMTITALTRQFAEHVTSFEKQMGELRRQLQDLQLSFKQTPGRSM